MTQEQEDQELGRIIREGVARALAVDGHLVDEITFRFPDERRIVMIVEIRRKP